MDLCGVDVYLWHDTLPMPPKTFKTLSLLFISNRGTRVYPESGPSVPPNDWHQCRYLSEASISDHEIDELIQQLTKEGWRWTKCQKLFQQDGAPLYSAPY